MTTGNNYTGQTAMSDAVVALRLGDGAVEWSRQITAGDEFNLYCRSQPDGCPGEDMDIGASAVLVALDDGGERLVVGQKSGWVYGLEPADNGRLIWQARVGEGGINGGVQWGMASDGARIYAAVSDLGRREQADRDAVDPRPNGVDPTQGGGLTALDVATGERVWFAAPPVCPENAEVCSPAVSECIRACTTEECPGECINSEPDCLWCFYQSMIACANPLGCQDAWNELACCTESVPLCSGRAGVRRLECAGSCPELGDAYGMCINAFGMECFGAAAMRCEIAP